MENKAALETVSVSVKTFGHQAEYESRNAQCSTVCRAAVHPRPLQVTLTFPNVFLVFLYRDVFSPWHFN